MKELERKINLTEVLDGITEKVDNRMFMKKLVEMIKEADEYVVITNIVDLKNCTGTFENSQGSDEMVSCIGASINPATSKFTNPKSGKTIEIYLDEHKKEVYIPESTKQIIYILNPRARRNFDETIRCFSELYKEIKWKKQNRRDWKNC